jgi:hypothetical protein
VDEKNISKKRCPKHENISPDASHPATRLA